MTENQLISFVLVLARVSSFVGFFPLFGRRQVPLLVKAGLAVSLTIFWMDSATMQVVDLSLVASGLALAKEIGIGFLLATALGFILIPAKIAGAYTGQEIGLSLAAISDPGSTDQSTIVTMAFEAIAIIVFFAVKGHVFVLLCVHYSFQADWNLLELPTQLLVEMVDRLPKLGLLILAPVGICMFVLLICLAFLNKAAPTLNLFSVGMPIRSGLGLLCLFVFMGPIIDALVDYFGIVQTDIERLLLFFM